jgi:DNA topoisomerase VI subunit A
MATPAAKFLGLQPSDIVEYELSTDKLTEQDISALRSELSDPRFESEYWKIKSSFSSISERRLNSRLLPERVWTS